MYSLTDFCTEQPQILIFLDCGGEGCHFDDDRWESWCPSCWRHSAEIAGVIRKTPGSVEDNQKQKDWVVMMSEKRRQQAEDNRIKVKILNIKVIFKYKLSIVERGRGSQTSRGRDSEERRTHEEKRRG